MTAKADITWEYDGDKKPLVPPGDYDAVIRGCRKTRPFGRWAVSIEVELLSGPHRNGSGTWGMNEPGATYQDPEGVSLEAHFNLRVAGGTVHLGPSCKYRRAFIAALDGDVPDSFDPEDLVGRTVRCRVRTVKEDANRCPLHPSARYSTVDTFLGPASPEAWGDVPF